MSDSTLLEVGLLSPASAATVLWKSRGAFRVTVVVKACFAIVPGSDAAPMPPLPIERSDQHRDADASRSLVCASDLAPYLPTTGVVLTGHAVAPLGRQARAVAARLGILRFEPILDRTLHVFGDVPAGDDVSLPFQRMPIVYERAYGGPGVAANPVGVGAPGTHGRPNVVDPLHPSRPAGFGPVARAWPERARHLTRLDESARVLSVPDDFDFRAFHAAPIDQQIAYLQGDEWIVLDHLVAAHERVQTRLPSARARARWHVVTAGGASEGQEIALVLDTLAIDTDAQTIAVTWRGHFTLDAPDLISMVRVFAGVEMPREPIEWPARDAIAKVFLVGQLFDSQGSQTTTAFVLTPPKGPALPFQSPDVVDNSILEELEVDVDADATTSSRRRANQRSGNTGEVVLKPPRAATPFGSRVPTLVAEGAPELKREIAIEQVDTTSFDGAMTLTGAGRSPVHGMDIPAFARALVDTRIPESIATVSVDPESIEPVTMAPQSIEAISIEPDFVEAVSVHAESIAPTSLEPTSLEPKTLGRPTLAPIPLVDVRALSAWPELAAPPLVSPPRPNAPTLRPTAPSESPERARAKEKLSANASFDDDDFTAADLSGLDFTGRSMVRCKLQRANLAGAVLNRALLAGAQMGEANLDGAQLEGADLTRADLAHAQLERARLDGAKLGDAQLSSARGTGASFRRASGERASFAKGTWVGAVFDGAELSGANFTASNLDGASMSDASLPELRLNDAEATQAKFDRARLYDVRAKGARLVRCSFAGADASHGQFGKAVLTASNFDGADLRSASFGEANAAESTFRGARLGESSFEHADLDGARFDDADLEDAKLSRARGDNVSFVGAKLVSADLRRASMPGANLSNASLRGARADEIDLTRASLTGADLSAASLRSAKLSGARVTNARLDGTDLRSANLDGAHVHGASRATAKLAGASMTGLVESPPDDG